ncbi:MAG: histidine kinase [Cyclobacteriaceae bacterium]|jgi:LytS/YehU family sensor histidine kinase|nr:histidine kinase [Cyclobacteriaceae bacterium]MDH4298619.1 histidine kinase [Cyclobacteriaceae bacterium]MDH5250640.1 histidine kinase [Cyclobacteriaceae bacterium]
MVINRKRIRTELQYAGFFVLAGVIQTYFTCSGCNSLREYALVSFFSFMLWVLLWRGNNLVTYYVSGKISWFKFPVKRLVVAIITTIGYTLLAVIGTMLLFESLFDFNFGSSFIWTIYFAVGITILISLVLHSREFLLRGRQATLDAELLQKETIIAKYESLKSQVSPHFLFNSFNALTNLVYEDQDKAAKFIKQLSEVYRYVLDSRDKEVVSLDEERKFLTAYLFLQQIRFGDKLDLNIQLDGTRSLVAPLVLQMLVENAIKHNIISTENPLKIYIYVEDEFIVIENNVQKKSVMFEESAGVGLDNIAKRYAFLSDKSVEISSGEKFIVKLPIIPEE